jgi:hypothetical protein
VITPPSPDIGGPYRVGPLRDTRVLKAHREAAASVIGDLLGVEVSSETAEAIAAKVLTAGDSSRPRYIVALRLERSGRLMMLGPFANPLAATKAVQRGLPLAGKARPYALVPWPRNDPQ